MSKLVFSDYAGRRGRPGDESDYTHSSEDSDSSSSQRSRGPPSSRQTHPRNRYRSSYQRASADRSDARDRRTSRRILEYGHHQGDERRPSASQNAAERRDSRGSRLPASPVPQRDYSPQTYHQEAPPQGNYTSASHPPGHYLPSYYAQPQHPPYVDTQDLPPARNPTGWGPLAHHSQSGVWEQLSLLQPSPEDRHPGNMLVSTRRPQTTGRRYPTLPAPKLLEAAAPEAATPIHTGSEGPSPHPHDTPKPAPRQGAAASDTASLRSSQYTDTESSSQSEAGLPAARVKERSGGGYRVPHGERTHEYQRRSAKRRNRQGLQVAVVTSDDDSLDSSDAEISTTRVDLVFDPSQTSKDLRVRLDLAVEEDWSDGLEELCRLRRLGLVKQAKKHFRSALENSGQILYVRVQYAEMLQSSGDYKGFQSLGLMPDPPPQRPSEETPDDRSEGKLVANYALLSLLSQRPISNFVTGAWTVVRRTLEALAAESLFGSTEVSHGKLDLSHQHTRST